MVNTKTAVYEHMKMTLKLLFADLAESFFRNFFLQHSPGNYNILHVYISLKYLKYAIHYITYDSKNNFVSLLIVTIIDKKLCKETKNVTIQCY